MKVPSAKSLRNLTLALGGIVLAVALAVAFVVGQMPYECYDDDVLACEYRIEAIVVMVTLAITAHGLLASGFTIALMLWRNRS